MSNPNARDLDWSSVVFAYGHLFAKDVRLLGVEVPLHSSKVNSQDLAQMMLVADFAALAQAGAISMSMGSSKMLFISTFTVAVKKVKDVPGGPVLSAILGQITGDAGKDTVKGIIYRAIGHDYADPYGIVAGWAKKDLLQRGYYRAEERGGIAQVVAGSKLAPLPDALNTLAPAAQSVQDALKQLQAANAELYKQLLSDALGALRSRVERDSSDND